MCRQTRKRPRSACADEARAGVHPFDMDQDYCARAAGSFATVCPFPEGASLKTLRQYLPGDDVIQLVIRLGLLAFLIYWTFVLIGPFVPILAWSIVLAVALYPVFALLARLLGGRPKLAAVILTLINLAIVIGPATWLGLSALDGVREFAGSLGAGSLVVPSPPMGVKNWTLIGPQLYELWTQASNNIRAALREVAPHLKPLAGATIRAVSQGVIGVAIIQSLLAGIGFKLAGVPGAGLLAFAVMLLTIVQIGAAIVLLPVIIWIWIDKDFTTALLLTLFLGIVGIFDNIVKPLVMGRGLTTPTLVIFIGVVGGTLAHGIVGLFIGPIILSLAF